MLIFVQLDIDGLLTQDSASLASISLVKIIRGVTASGCSGLRCCYVAARHEPKQICRTSDGVIIVITQHFEDIMAGGATCM